MLIVDTNNILSIGEQSSTGKEYTRIFFGYPLSSYDHTILIYTKKGFEQKQWKDIGSGQSILQYKTFVISSETDKFLNKGYARLGFDILYKYDETKGEAINIAKVDSTIQDFAHSIFGTSMTALAMASYEKCLEKDAIISFLFGICIAHGNWVIKNNILFPIKVTIPLTSSLLGKKDFFEKLTHILHSMQIIHSIQYIHTGIYELVQLTLHDTALLYQYSQWLNPIVKIDKISTLAYTQKVYEELEKYTNTQGFVLPIKSASELVVLEAD